MLAPIPAATKQRWPRLATTRHSAAVSVRGFPRRTELSSPARSIIDERGWRRLCIWPRCECGAFPTVPIFLHPPDSSSMTAVGDAPASARCGCGASPAEPIFLRPPDPSSMTAAGDASAFGCGAGAELPPPYRSFFIRPIHHRWPRLATSRHCLGASAELPPPYRAFFARPIHHRWPRLATILLSRANVSLSRWPKC